MEMEWLYISIVLAPLIGSMISGLFPVTRPTAHFVTIFGVGISFILSLLVFYSLISGKIETFNETIYNWAVIGNIRFEIGFLIDELTVTMMTVVTFVSLMVHIYTIGYMKDDEHNWLSPSEAGTYSYQRFFSYISLFTFSMLMLVMANNFLQLFFGWEAVGLVSYLLIGFWFQRESAVFANMKAFLVNRVGDFGFLLGIAGILLYFGSLNYSEVFGQANHFENTMISFFPGVEWSVISLICFLLFIGAMGKSAQMPLHVWLPDSMEGPTPISALIHAATMVTAGIFMIARMSPLFELSPSVLSFILIIGASTALFMGFLGLIQNDIKRVVAYSTLSQLGYMTAALGASAYTAGIFHLMTHAFFKALLFLAAGSVIIAMHHKQDMREMGGLRHYLPITWITCLIGSIALIGFPGTAGFYSKDGIIEAVHIAYEHHRFGAGFAYYALLAGVFITALYSFRMYFMVFHGKERMDNHTKKHLHENSMSVTLPLIILAIPSLIIGAFAIEPMLFNGYFGNSIYMNHDPFHELHHDADTSVWISFLAHALLPPSLPIIFATSGVVTAWVLFYRWPEIPEFMNEKLRPVHTLLENKYYFDYFNEKFLARFVRFAGVSLSEKGEQKLIDGLVVNGAASSVYKLSSVIRYIQTGFLYHYAFVMIIGLLILLSWFVLQAH